MDNGGNAGSWIPLKRATLPRVAYTGFHPPSRPTTSPRRWLYTLISRYAHEARTGKVTQRRLARCGSAGDRCGEPRSWRAGATRRWTPRSQHEWRGCEQTCAASAAAGDGACVSTQSVSQSRAGGTSGRLSLPDGAVRGPLDSHPLLLSIHLLLAWPFEYCPA